MSNRTQKEIDEQMTALINVIEQLNQDYHDNCSSNTCEACIGC